MPTLIQRAKDRVIIVPYIFRVFPAVERELTLWKKKASDIPDEELRRQALASIDSKRFHCQGGSIYALYTPAKAEALIQFIVALQTISDYLDNLCDRVEGASHSSFGTLHQAMIAAVDIDAPLCDWYADYPYQGDDDYLNMLVHVCRRSLKTFPGYEDVREALLQQVHLYSDLQVYKHMDKRLRVEMLVRWYARNATRAPNIFWWEFSAAAGSTLSVFALSSMAAAGFVSQATCEELLTCYFPWLCGLHILLDYFIDIEEDNDHGDLNFVSFYPGAKAMGDGLMQFLRCSLENVEQLPRPDFHRTVTVGLLALYLSDPKALHDGRSKISQQLLRYGGREAVCLYSICKALRNKGVI